MNEPQSDDSEWVTVETRVRGKIAVEVRRKDNHNAGQPPLYSIRVGRHRVQENAEVWINPHMSIYDTDDVLHLIAAVSAEYRALRLEQQGRRVVDHRRGARMGMSKNGELTVTQQPRVTGVVRNRFYADPDGDD